LKNYKHKTAFRIIALALGEKSGKNEKEADTIALIRLVIILQAIVTNGFIIANAVYNLSGGPIKKESTPPPPTDYRCYSVHSSQEKTYDL
jgi:hypothetical protein